MPAVERLEPKQLLNAILVGNDSVQLQQSQTAAPPVELNVLDNDSSPSGGLTITSVQSPLHGSASIVSADPNDPTSHDRLSVAFDAAFTGTEWFTYSVADADGDQATGTVTVTVVPTAYGSGSGGTSGMGGYGSAPSTPQVTGLMNSSGGTAGGTAVMIGGSGFGQVTQVLFGSTVATSFTVNSDASITAVAPPHGEGSVDVLVVSSVGASGVTMNDRFRYQAAVGAPTISSVSPGTSTVSGGDTLRITGTGFTNVTAVTVGGTAVSGFTVVSPTTIQVVAPPHMSGQVDVEVTTSAGTSPDSINDRLVYTTPVLPPVVMGLTTTTGSTAGGTSVTIMGANFTDVSAVWFGNQQAASFVVNSSTSITAVTPAELAGTVGVTVTNGAGTSGTQSNDQFTFQSNDPAISGLSTATGTTDGGTNVTIGGTNLHGVTAVYFGTVAATSFVVTGPGSISVVAPPQAQGTVDVTLVSAGGTSATSPADQFTYSPADAPPTVTGVTAPTSSGINIAITGTNFHNVMSVSIGGSAVMFLVQSPTSIVAVPPSTLTGTVEVTVTTAAGTSAPSTADQVRLGSAATGSSGSGSSGSGSSGTSSGSTGNSAADYVVVTQVGLGMDSQSVGNMELLGQMTGPGLPSIPVVPVNHPVNSSSADYANGVVSYSTTDGGTLTEDHVSTVINTDGSTYSRVQTGTTTFSYSSISSSSGNGPSTSSVLIMVDTNYHTVETLTAAHGTGYQRIWDQETITNYSLSTANGTSTFHNDVDEIRGYGDVESGVAAAGSAVRVSVGHQTTDDYHRIVSGTTTYGVTVGSFVSTDLGSGTFSKQSGLHTADETDTTSRSGGDHWNAIVQGTFTYGPDGSRIVNSQYTGNGGGSDEYTNTDEARSTVTTPDEYGSTIVRNTFTEHDAGTDDYGDVHTGTYVRTADGSDTTTETRNDGDSGTEDNDTGNVGSVDSNQTLSDGTVIQAHEGFSDTNDDISHYDDSENEQYGTGAVSPAAAAPGAAGGSAGNTDKFHHGQDDTDTFHTSETDNITATSTGLFGAVTTVTITGGVGDDGRIKTKDKLDDTEQLGANKADLEDDFTFDDQVHEQDKATGNEKIVIETHGLVAAGEQVDSKETISLKDVTNHSDDEDDVGTEEDQPNRADTEQDTDTIARHSDDDIHFTDKLDLTATQTLADGTVITNQVHDDVKHHIVDSADDGNTDVHTVHPVASGSGTPVADDDTFDNRFHETDDYSATDSMSQSVVIPVTGGTLRFGSGDSLVDEGTATETDEESGETNSGQSSANRETDTRDVTNSDGGTAKSNDWFRLITTDPTTGFVTNIRASDDNTNHFTDSFGDDSTQRSGTAVAGGNAGSTSPANAAPAAMNGGTGSTGGGYCPASLDMDMASVNHRFFLFFGFPSSRPPTSGLNAAYKGSTSVKNSSVKPNSIAPSSPSE